MMDDWNRLDHVKSECIVWLKASESLRAALFILQQNFVIWHYPSPSHPLLVHST